MGYLYVVSSHDSINCIHLNPPKSTPTLIRCELEDEGIDIHPAPTLLVKRIDFLNLKNAKSNKTNSHDTIM